MECANCGSEVAQGIRFCGNCGAPLEEAISHVLVSGTALQNGRFLIDKVLGQGAFGITYLGTDTFLKRPIAIKEYFPMGSNRLASGQVVAAITGSEQFNKFRERFLQEAQLLAQFNHPGIVGVLDAFEGNGTAYMVMEYVEGQNLRVRVKNQGVLSGDEAYTLAQDLIGGLEWVHGANHLHRDIKPDNILIEKGGRAVLIDFGAARSYQLDRSMQLTAMGTEGYAPPEQYASRGRFGPYTDIYGLCATLYYCLTGKEPPLVGDRVVGVDPDPLTGLAPDNLVKAVEWGMRLKMDERPQSLGELKALF